MKLAYDFDNGWQLSYLASLFHQDDDAGVDSWLRDPSGAVIYAGNSNINGYNYNIAASTFSNNVYNWQQSQLAQGLTLKSGADGDFQWEAIASRYDYLNDKQRVPTAALPGAFTAGAGTINRMNGTGWYTLDADAAWRGWTDHEISFGAHRDAETFAQLRNNLTDWIAGGLGSAVNSAPRDAPPPMRCGCRTSGRCCPISRPRQGCAMKTGAPMTAPTFPPRRP